jgi:hypothetical protein
MVLEEAMTAVNKEHVCNLPPSMLEDLYQYQVMTACLCACKRTEDGGAVAGKWERGRKAGRD